MTDILKIKITGKTYEKCPEDGCVIVNKKHYEALKNSIINWKPDGYAQIIFKDDNGIYKITGLHKYVVSVLENIKIPRRHIVHHIDSNRYNNDINNLEVATYSLNNSAITRPKRSSITKYKGLHFCSQNSKWVPQITYNGKAIHLGIFETDKEAAMTYDIAYHAVHRTSTGNNGLLTEEWKEKIDNDRESYIPVAKYDNRELPKYVIKLPSGNYRVRFRAFKIDKVFKNLDDAKSYIKVFFDDIEKKKQDELMSRPIVRDDNGIPIVPVRNKITDDVQYAFVDEEDWHKVMSKNWCLDKSGYAVSESDYDQMHRFVMKCIPHDEKIVDHKNFNKLDNRKSINLRYVTESFNQRNKPKRQGTSSQYTGVYWKNDRNKWAAYININNIRKHLGHFNDEEEASEAYQKVYKELEDKETSFYQY
jgi:hypothetical protein